MSKGWFTMARQERLAARFAAELHLDHKLLRDVLQLWDSKRSDGAPPARASFGAAELKPFLPNLIIAEFEAASRRYRFRLIGTAIAETFQRDATGQYLDEIYTGDELETLREGFDAVRLTRNPKALTGTLCSPRRASLALEGLLMPLEVTAGQNPQILVAVYFRYAEDLGYVDIEPTSVAADRASAA